MLASNEKGSSKIGRRGSAQQKAESATFRITLLLDSYTIKYGETTPNEWVFVSFDHRIADTRSKNARNESGRSFYVYSSTINFFSQTQPQGHSPSIEKLTKSKK